MIILAATLVLSFLALSKSEWEVGDSPHDVIGVICLAFNIFINLTGFIARFRLLPKLPISWIHRISGFVMILLG